MRLFKKHWRAVFPVILALMLFLSIIIFKPPFLPEEFFAEPVIAPVEPEASQAEERAWEIPAEAIPGAVAILADGKTVCVLSSADEARELLLETLNKPFEREGEVLISLEYVNIITLRYAEPGEEPIDTQEAAKLISSSCPVRALTRCVSVESIANSTDQTDEKRLMKSTRMVVDTGLTGEVITINEYAYIDGVKEDEPVLSEQIIRAPVNEKIAVGTFTSKNKEPGSGEGVKGPDAPKGFSLKAPCSGKIIANFGIKNSRMYNGIDYSAKVGDNISAAAAGVIIFARERGSYGFLVEIDHGEGFVTRLSPIAGFELKLGDTVEKGQLLGTLAAPIYEDEEPRLHMELLIEGMPYNPRQYLK